MSHGIPGGGVSAAVSQGGPGGARPVFFPRPAINAPLRRSDPAGRRKECPICGLTKLSSIRSIPWACAARRRTTTGIPSTASCGCWTGWSTSNSWGRTPSCSIRCLTATATATTPGTTTGWTPAWGPTKTWPRCAAPFTTPGSGSCWTECSTMWAGASGPFGTYRRRSGTAPTGTGSI